MSHERSMGWRGRSEGAAGAAVAAAWSGCLLWMTQASVGGAAGDLCVVFQPLELYGNNTSPAHLGGPP